MKDYYALLGIEKNASKREIKKNYHLLATKFHPDKNTDPEAATKFIAITEAYDVLSNRKYRAEYDLKRWQALKEMQESADSFTVVVPPSVSLHTRRNIAQQKRSRKYHKASSNINKSILLLIECLYIIGRYALHVFGITLLVVTLNSAIGQVSDSFGVGYGTGIPVSILIAVLVFGIFKTMQIVIKSIKKDITVFSITYKLSKGRAALFLLSIFILVLLFFIVFILSF